MRRDLSKSNIAQPDNMIGDFHTKPLQGKNLEDSKTRFLDIPQTFHRHSKNNKKANTTFKKKKGLLGKVVFSTPHHIASSSRIKKMEDRVEQYNIHKIKIHIIHHTTVAK